MLALLTAASFVPAWPVAAIEGPHFTVEVGALSIEDGQPAVTRAFRAIRLWSAWTDATLTLQVPWTVEAGAEGHTAYLEMVVYEGPPSIHVDTAIDALQNTTATILFHDTHATNVTANQTSSGTLSGTIVLHEVQSLVILIAAHAWDGAYEDGNESWRRAGAAAAISPGAALVTAMPGFSDAEVVGAGTRCNRDEATASPRAMPVNSASAMAVADVGVGACEEVDCSGPSCEPVACTLGSRAPECGAGISAYKDLGGSCTGTLKEVTGSASGSSQTSGGFGPVEFAARMTFRWSGSVGLHWTYSCTFWWDAWAHGWDGHMRRVKVTYDGATLPHHTCEYDGVVADDCEAGPGRPTNGRAHSGEDGHGATGFARTGGDYPGEVRLCYRPGDLLKGVNEPRSGLGVAVQRTAVGPDCKTIGIEYCWVEAAWPGLTDEVMECASEIEPDI